MNPIKNNVLTDVEIDQIVAETLKNFQETLEGEEGARFLPVCVTRNDWFEITIWFSDHEITVSKLDHSENVENPILRQWKLHWTKKGNEITVGKYSRERGSTCHYLSLDIQMPWEGGRYHEPDRVLKTWPENIKKLREEDRLKKEINSH